MSVQIEDSLFSSTSNKLIPLHHYANNGEKVILPVELKFFPEIHNEVHLLSPNLHQERYLIYMYVQEMIDLFPLLQKEGLISKDISSILHTLLLALDYLTHQDLISTVFTDEYQQTVKSILQEVLEENKTHHFTSNSGRPSLLKSAIYQEGDTLYAIDDREERGRIYMAVLYKKTTTLMEHFSQVGYWIGSVKIPIKYHHASSEDMLNDISDCQLHSDTMYYLNMTKGVFSWILNSYSYKNNQLESFDKMDIVSKLGVKYLM